MSFWVLKDFVFVWDSSIYVAVSINRFVLESLVVYVISQIKVSPPIISRNFSNILLPVCLPLVTGLPLSKTYPSV